MVFWHFGIITWCIWMCIYDKESFVLSSEWKIKDKLEQCHTHNKNQVWRKYRSNWYDILYMKGVGNVFLYKIFLIMIYSVLQALWSPSSCYWEWWLFPEGTFWQESWMKFKIGGWKTPKPEWFWWHIFLFKWISVCIRKKQCNKSTGSLPSADI